MYRYSNKELIKLSAIFAVLCALCYLTMGAVLSGSWLDPRVWNGHYVEGQNTTQMLANGDWMAWHAVETFVPLFFVVWPLIFAFLKTSIWARRKVFQMAPEFLSANKTALQLSTALAGVCAFSYLYGGAVLSGSWLDPRVWSGHYVAGENAAQMLDNANWMAQHALATFAPLFFVVWPLIFAFLKTVAWVRRRFFPYVTPETWQALLIASVIAFLLTLSGSFTVVMISALFVTPENLSEGLAAQGPFSVVFEMLDSYSYLFLPVFLLTWGLLMMMVLWFQKRQARS